MLLKGTMGSPSVSNRIVFLDAEQVVIATPASNSSKDPRMLDILERRTNSTGQEREELDKERALLSNENRAALELQTFRLDSTLDAQLAQAHPPIKVQEGFAFNRDGARIATHAVIFNEGESRLQSTILILDGRTGEQIDQLPSPFPQARVLALSPDAARMVVAESVSSSIPSGPVTARAIEITILERTTLNSNSVPLRDYNKGAPRFAFSPDGTRLAVDLGLGVQKLAIIDASIGRELFSISNDASSVTSRRPLETFGSKSGDFVAFSPDGKWLVSNAASIDRATNVLKVWEAANGKLGTEFKGNTSRTIQAAFSADSKQLYVADQSGSIKVWRLPTKTASELNENAARPLAVQNGEVLPAARITARSSDRRWTASAPASSYYVINQGGGGPSANRSTSPAEPPFEIKLKDTSGRVPPQTLPLSGPAERLTFSPDGSFLESISVDESAKLDEAVELKVWSVATGKLAILPALRFRATDKAVNMRIVSTLLQPFVQSETKPHSSDLSLFSPDSQRLVCVFAPSGTGREQLAIRMWDLSAGRELTDALAEPLASFLNSMNFPWAPLTFSSDSKLLLIANTRSSGAIIIPTGVRILNAMTGELRWTEDSPIEIPVFSSDASRLAGIRISTDVGGGLPSAAIVVWDAATGQEVGLIPLPPNHNATPVPFGVKSGTVLPSNHNVRALAASNKGSHVAVATEGSVTLYDVATATPLHVWDGKYSSIWFPPDGKRLVAYMYSNLRKEAKVWDVETRQEMLSRKLSERGTGPSLVSDEGTTTGLWTLPAQAEADGLVDWLSAADGDGRFLTRSQIAEQIKTDPFVSAEAKAIALKLASNVRRSAEALSTQALKILNSPTQPRDEFQLALDWINEAVEQDKENSSYASCQGIAYYRLGRYVDALTALARSKELHAAQKRSPSAEDLTILAMAQHQAGQRDEARTTLKQVRTSASRNKLTGQKLLAEAETLLAATKMGTERSPHSVRFIRNAARITTLYQPFWR